MNKIKIFADSTCDLSPELIKDNNISIIPLNVTFGDDTYKDGIDISTTELYEKVQEFNQLPKTSAPPPGVIKEAFAPYIEEGYDIIYISLSSQISATYQNALLAAGMFPEDRVLVIDSKNLCTGIGILVMKAVDFLKQGLSAKEIAKKIYDLTPYVEIEFVVDTLDYLYKGGRCSSVQKFAGGLLKIRPSIKVVDGKVVPAKKFRGKREKMLKDFVENALKAKGDIDDKRVFVSHSQGEESAKFLKERLEQELKVEEVLVTEAGCVISSHCGPNTVAIVYIRKS